MSGANFLHQLGPATQVTLIPWQLILWISWILWIALPGMTISGRFWPSFAPRDTGSYLHDFPARSLPARPITSQDASLCLDRCSLSDLGLIVYKNGWSGVTWGMHFSKHQAMEASIRSGCKILRRARRPTASNDGQIVRQVLPAAATSTPAWQSPVANAKANARKKEAILC